MDTFAAHHTVNRLHTLLFPLRVNTFDPHRAGVVAGSAFRTGSAVFFQLEQIKPLEKPHQIPHRTDNAPKTLDEKAAYQDHDCKKSAKI